MKEMDRLWTFFSSVECGIVAIDEGGRVPLINSSARQMLDLHEEQILERSIKHILPEEGQKILNILKASQSTQYHYIPELTKRTFGFCVSVFQDGNIAGALLIVFARESLGRFIEDLHHPGTLNRELKGIFDSSYDGIWLCNKHGTVLAINKASEEINNIKAEDYVGRNVRDLLAEGYMEKSITLEVIDKKEPVTLVRESRKGKQILITGNPVFDEGGNVDLVVLNERDISELIQLRDELDQSKALSEEYSLELQKMRMYELEKMDIIIRSKEMRAVIDLATKASKVDSTVLLLGESGVGKGAIAGLIHRLSKRKDKNFMTVNCGALPESLIEAELFGYEKGAFTGAPEKGKPGLFELAHQGTLFIDEIDGIPLRIQAKILKFLEDNEIIRIGAVSWRKIDTRIIVASNRDLHLMVKDGTLRRDLYYRLNVLTIEIPPLRERPSDIPLLVNFFVKNFNQLYGLKKRISQSVIDVLHSYTFPGNVRELRNIIESLIVLSDSEVIKPEDLPKEIRDNVGLPVSFRSEENLQLPEFLATIEKGVIQEAIHKYKTTTETAKALGVSQPTIVRKLKKYHIT